MAHTPVQVYTGLSVSECLEQYGTENPPRINVSMHSTPGGARRGFDAPIVVMTAAASCRNERCSSVPAVIDTVITAGTIWASTTVPLTVWFQAMYVMTQDKKGLSAMTVHRHLGIS